MSDYRREELEELAARVRHELETKGIPPEELNAALRTNPESAPGIAQKRTFTSNNEPLNRRLVRVRRKIKARRTVMAAVLTLAILVAGFAMFRTSRVQGASSKPHVAVTPKPLPVVSALQSTLGANPSVNIVEPELQIVPVKTVPVGREHSRTNSQEKPAPVADVIVKPNTLERKHDKPFGVNPPNEKPVVLTHKQPGQHEEKSAPTPKEDKPVVVYAAPRKEPSPFDAYLGNSHPARQEITPAAPLDEDSSPSQRRRSRTARTDDTPRDDNRYYLERGLDERRTRSERRVTVRVCVDSGEIAGRGCPHTALLNVPASDAPNRACRLHHAR